MGKRGESLLLVSIPSQARALNSDTVYTAVRKKEARLQSFTRHPTQPLKIETRLRSIIEGESPPGACEPNSVDNNACTHTRTNTRPRTLQGRCRQRGGGSCVRVTSIRSTGKCSRVDSISRGIAVLYCYKSTMQREFSASGSR